MDKVLIVAKTEFASAVRTRGFIASLLMLPVIYGVMIAVQIFANKADVEPRKFAVLDRTGKLFPFIKVAAEDYNKKAIENGKRIRPDFLPIEAKPDGTSSGQEIAALSERVRSKELYAFVEIPADAIEAKPLAKIILKYYTENPNYRELSVWINVAVGISARALRYEAAGFDPMLVAKIDRQTDTETFGLEGKKVDPARAIFIPLGLGMLVFIVTMNAGPQLVTAVMEEKISRISEMLLGSLSTFQLMLGKLIGNAATAMLTTVLYLGTAYAAAYRAGYADAVTPRLIGALILFVFIAIFLFGSLYMAVGAACSEMKDAQSLMMPVMMLSMLPMMFMGPMLSNPGGKLASVVSMVPFATPILMTMRMAMNPAPPAWQVLVSIGLTAVTAIVCVWASAKIFRTGLLMHGKAPTFRELFKWVVAK